MFNGKCGRWLVQAALASIVVFMLSWAVVAAGGATVSVPGNLGRAWEEPSEEFVPGEYLVRFKEGVAEKDALSVLGRSGMQVVKRIWFRPGKTYPDGLTIYHVKAADGVKADSAVAALRSNPAVKYARQSRKLYAYQTIPQLMPDDLYLSLMWGLNNTGQEFYPGYAGTPDADIDAPEAWQICHEAPSIVVADIDTGIQWNHPDLVSNIWVNPGEVAGNNVDDDNNGYVDDIYGWDFVNEDNTVYDGIDDHGTHTAGTVGAVGNNALGVTGVAWNVKIMCLKFLENGTGTDVDAIEAFAYAWNNGADLTTNSWGGTGTTDLNDPLMEAMAAAEIIHVCAAGNDGTENGEFPGYSHYPSSYPLDNIIAVAASDWDDNLCDFSCWGATTVDIAAPGDMILSTAPTDQYDPPYLYMGGTSMATPHVAGAVALLMAYFPEMPAYPGEVNWEPGDMSIKDLIIKTADVKPAFAGKVVSNGRLNLYRALIQDIPAPPDISVSPTSLYARIRPEENESRTFTIANTGEDVLNYEIVVDSNATAGKPKAPEARIPHVEVAKGEDDPRPSSLTPDGSGGPDLYGHSWVDSDSPGGPVYQWIDITAVGQPGPSGDDAYISVTLPWVLDFYGQPKNTLKISTNGYLTFGADGTDYSNDPIPDSEDPNDLLAVFWDDLNAPAGTTYYYYDAANDRFIVSWVGVTKLSSTSSLNFQAILYPDGRIRYQYQTMTGDLTSATIGIEDSNGSDGLQVVYNAAYVHDNLAIEFSVPWLSVSPSTGVVLPGEDVDITVTFRGNGKPIGTYGADILVLSTDPDEPETVVQATMEITDNYAPVIEEIAATPNTGEPPLSVAFNASAHDPDGEIVDWWWDFGDGSPISDEWNPTHVYVSEGEYDAVFTVVDDGGRTATESVHVSVHYVPDITAGPTSFSVKLNPGYTASRTLTIMNEGRADLHFRLRSSKSAAALPVKITAKPVDPNAVNTRGLLIAARPGVRPADVGDVITSFLASAPNLAWGTGYDGINVWVGHIDENSGATVDHQYTTEGVLTGLSFGTPWAGSWAGDMTWDGMYIWQVNVGGDNGIYCLDPATGDVVTSIHDPDGVWDATSQRGLAYDPETDTFYVGGWNSDKVFHIKGLSWDVPGEIIGQFSFDAGIAGLAFHPAGVLWVTTNSSPDMVYALDPATGTVIASFAHPCGGEYLGAGCEIDSYGNLWMSSMDNMVYLVDTGMPSGLPWLSTDPVSGVVAPGGSMEIVLTFDATELEPGEYRGDLVLSSDDPDEPEVIIPVELVVNDSPVVEITAPVGGETWWGVQEITWTAEDPDGDPVTIDIYYTDDLGETWYPLALDEPNDGVFEWDTSKVANGGHKFMVRISATDDMGRVGEDVSGRFAIIRLSDMVMAVPNPVRDSATFYYDLDAGATLYVYDITGRLVYSTDLNAGTGSTTWSLETNGGEPLANGLYLYLVVTDSGEKSGVKRLVISR